MKLTMKSIKLEVTRAIAQDPGLADAITVAVGFTPRWSRLDIVGCLLVWLAYKSLVPASYNYWPRDLQSNYRNVFLAVSGLPEAQQAKESQSCSHN